MKTPGSPLSQNCLLLVGIVSTLVAGEVAVPAATPEGDAPGTLSVTGSWSFDNPSTQDHTGDQRFTVLVRGRQYLIAFESRRAFSPGYTIVTSDGVDTFSTSNPLDWTPPSGLAPVRPKESKSRFATGAVYPSSFPTGEGMVPAQVLWLAYCYPCQANLRISSTNVLPFNTVTGYKVAPVTEFKTKAALTNTAVEQLDFYAPGRGSDSQRGGEYEFPPPYASGWLQSRFLGTGFTTLQALSIPRSVTFQDFTTKKDASGPEDVAPFGTYRVSAAEMTVLDEFPPVFPPLASDGKTIVNDHRLTKAGGEPLGFAVGENGNFALRESPEFRDMQRNLRKEARRKLLASVTFYLVLGGALLLFGWKIMQRQKSDEVPAG
ncbi:MAG: hypothetical protein H7A47_15000 [Verrucomicrobiales bacterium]|nr:hypothetical protein [Verrucomicrobiales bacterium]